MAETSRLAPGGMSLPHEAVLTTLSPEQVVHSVGQSDSGPVGLMNRPQVCLWCVFRYRRYLLFGARDRDGSWI